jgi:Raf kinase inhibitor-like YbhB/YbcL family protein
MTDFDVHTDYRVLKISSRAIKENSFIPSRYTHYGRDIHPPIDIGMIPLNAKTLALIMEDSDVNPLPLVHWVAFNIPPTHHIGENENPGVSGTNDFDRNSFCGPRMHYEDIHRYRFKFYALDVILNLPEGSNRQALEPAMSNHILAYGEFTGLYL